MNKLRLEPEELCVESFPTVEEQRAERGTVRGHAPAPGSEVEPAPVSWPQVCWTIDPYQSTCQPVYTCPECASPPETRYACEPPIEA